MKFKFDYPISNFDIISFCKKYKIVLNDVIMLEQFISNTKYGNYIINLDEENGNGTHWTALTYNKDYAIYFDSFGIIPPLEIIQQVKSKLLHHSVFIIQDGDSVMCGWFCIFFTFYAEIKYYSNY
jgi:hypothetical protein